MPVTRTLWGLNYSPWTEKARWALDHHGVSYQYREHLPLLGEPGLRWRTRGRPAGAPASVPLLLDDDGVHGHSDDIARRAEAIGSGAPLFRPELDGDIRRLCEAGDRALQAARALVVAAIEASPEAQVESLPPFMPGAIRPAMRGVARQGASFLARKYNSGARSLADHEAALARWCEEIEATLDGRDYLLGDALSYADLATAVAINGFAPLRERFFAGSPATARAWTRAALVEQYGALVGWRDRLYAEHR